MDKEEQAFISRIAERMGVHQGNLHKIISALCEKYGCKQDEQGNYVKVDTPPD